MKPVKKMTFEEAFAELEETVQKLEEGGAALDDSLALFERGQELAAYCGVKLDQAELKIRQLTPEGEVAPLEDA